MILDGEEILVKGIVKLNDVYTEGEQMDQIQPNGIDLRVHDITKVLGQLSVPRSGRVNYGALEVAQIHWERGWTLVKPGDSYIVEFEEFISVPDGYCAIIEPRSSLLRSGVNIASGVWDTGFQGSLGGVIRPFIHARIEKGARIAQVQVHESRFDGHRYNGRYQGATSRAAFMR